MRTLKMLALAALAVAVAMAFADIGTASAQNTVICQVNQTPCEDANVVDNGPFARQGVEYKEGVQLEAETVGQTAELKVTLFGTQAVLCHSAVRGYTTERVGSMQLPGSIEELTFNECKFRNLAGTLEPCTQGTEGTHAIQLQYRFLLSHKELEQGHGWLYIYEHAGGKENENQPGAIVECLNIPLAPINCEYKVAEKELHQESLPETLEGAKLQVVGGSVGTATPPKIIAEQVQLKALNVPNHESCPGTEPKWNATYNVTSPVQELFVESHP